MENSLEMKSSDMEPFAIGMTLCSVITIITTVVFIIMYIYFNLNGPSIDNCQCHMMEQEVDPPSRPVYSDYADYGTIAASHNRYSRGGFRQTRDNLGHSTLMPQMQSDGRAHPEMLGTSSQNPIHYMPRSYGSPNSTRSVTSPPQGSGGGNKGIMPASSWPHSGNIAVVPR